MAMATNIGKWFAYVLIVFVIAFLVLAFFKENFVDIFSNWALKIIYALVGGTVIYIIINIVSKKR